jgi:hypothetical protein
MRRVDSRIVSTITPPGVWVRRAHRAGFLKRFLLIPKKGLQGQKTGCPESTTYFSGCSMPCIFSYFFNARWPGHRQSSAVTP